MPNEPMTATATTPASRPDGDERPALLAIGGLALLVRTLLLLLPRAIRWDEPVYLLLGRSLWSGGPFTVTGPPEVHFPPLAPILFGGTWQLFGRPELATEIWFVLFGTLLVLPVYWLARRLYGVTAARLAALLVAVYPGLTTAVLFWGTMTEPLFVFLLYAGFLLAWRGSEAVGRRGAIAAGAGAGACLALAYLTRPEAILWVASAVATIYASAALAGRLRTAAPTVTAVSLILAAVLVALPYVVYLHDVSGRWMISGKTGITYEIGQAVLEDDAALYDEVTNAIDPETGEVRWLTEERVNTAGPIERLVERPGEVVGRVAGNLLRILRRIVVQPIVPILLVPFPAIWGLGLVRPPWSRQRWAAELWPLAAAAPTAVFLLFHVQQRFFSPLFPALLLWTAAGATTAVRWARRRWRPAGVAMAVLLALSLGFSHVGVHRQQATSVRGIHRQLGHWIRDHTPADSRVMAYELAVCVYAERRCLLSPRTDPAGLVRYARERGGAILVVDRAETAEARPFLLPLMDTRNPPPGFEPLHRTADDTADAIVYRLGDG